MYNTPHSPPSSHILIPFPVTINILESRLYVFVSPKLNHFAGPRHLHQEVPMSPRAGACLDRCCVGTRASGPPIPCGLRDLPLLPLLLAQSSILITVIIARCHLVRKRITSPKQVDPRDAYIFWGRHRRVGLGLLTPFSQIDHSHTHRWKSR